MFVTADAVYEVVLMDDFFSRAREELDRALMPQSSFDVLRRVICFGGGRALFYYIDGFVNENSMSKIFEYVASVTSVEELGTNIPYIELDLVTDIRSLVTAVLCGGAVMLAEGRDCGTVIDARTYHARGISEPEKDKVLRGPHDGFGEVLINNTALIRRRVRCPELRMELMRIGKRTACDTVIAYVEGVADERLVKAVRERLAQMKDIGAVNLSAESISELLVRRSVLNPFPKIRYTERPDAASAMLMEGSVILMCDNTPSAMILPTSIFDFLQESDDYYFPPTVGTYLRLVRLITLLGSILLIPLWLVALDYADSLPAWLGCVVPRDDYAMPIVAQLLLVEILVDGLKLASLNTPDALSNSFSVVAGLILGDFAVEIGLLVPQVILLISFTALASFAQPSYELGYAIKFVRILMIILISFFRGWGFIAGVIIGLALIATNSTVPGGRGYLYPLIPFSARALGRVFFRRSLK